MSQDLETIQRTALVELQAGNIDKTIELMRSGTELTEKLHGDDSLETAQALSTLALCLARRDENLVEARYLSLRSLEIRKTKKGDVDVSVALTAEFLASLELRLGNLVSSEKNLRLCVLNALAIVGPTHINTAKVQYLLGLVLGRQSGNTDESRDLLEASFETRLRVLGKDAPETVQSKSALVEILNRLNDTDRLKELSEDDGVIAPTISVPFQQCMR